MRHAIWSTPHTLGFSHLFVLICFAAKPTCLHYACPFITDLSLCNLWLTVFYPKPTTPPSNLCVTACSTANIVKKIDFSCIL